ncbi:MAG: glycosyltransferase [Candidatus Sifarchaeia archaeon]
MRILQVVPVYSSILGGGTYRVVKSIAKELSKKHDVTIYTTAAKSQYYDYSNKPFEKKIDGYTVVYFPRNLVKSGLSISISMALELIRRYSDFDVVHVHSWRNFQDPLLLAINRLFNTKYLLQTHGSISRAKSKNIPKFVYDYSIGRKVLGHAKRLLALSKLEGYQYHSLGVPKEKISIIPNGIDLGEYKIWSNTKIRIRRKFGIAEQEKIVTFLGRLHETKGLGLLVDAFAIATEEIENLRLVFVGPDDGFKNQLIKQISELKLQNHVTFTGFISMEEKLATLRESEVFVTPTFNAFPISFLESCFCRCPILTTSNELSWIDGNVGIVTEHNSNSLGAALKRILIDDSLKQLLRKNCESTIQKFSMTVIGSKLEQIYMNAIR